MNRMVNAAARPESARRCSRSRDQSGIDRVGLGVVSEDEGLDGSGEDSFSAGFSKAEVEQLEAYLQRMLENA